MSADLSTTLNMETSELELIEKDLASTRYVNNQQEILRSFHSTSRAFNEAKLPQHTPSVSFSFMDSSDNMKKHNHNKVFVELYDLDLQKGGEWTETARWIKYEEDVEGTDHHWGQPHVAFLSFHALISLRKFMRTGMILLDCKAKTFADVCDRVANVMINEGITCKRRDIMQILGMKQAFPNLPAIPAFQERLCLNPTKQSSAAHFISDSLGKVRTHSSELHKGEDILRKLPAGTETAQIFVGVIPNLTKTHFVMLRLSAPTVMPEILDGEIPLRFVVVILGPGQPDEFNAVAYEANIREELICGVDNFLADSVVIPPGDIDSKRLLSGDEIRKALKKRQNRRKVIEEENRKYTNEKIGILETLMAQCICGVLWGVFAVQPLMIMSATGPVLVFEVSLYAFCTNLNIDFLTVRLYAGLWVLLISIIAVALDGSRMLRYVTRFTEDIFASLISVIFIAESVRFLYQTFIHNPVASFQFYQHIRQKCEIDGINGKRNDSQMMAICDGEPNTALLTTFIMISTFALAYGLRQLRQSYYLGRTLRRALGDFGVLIAIAVVASLAHLFVPDPYLQRLEVPDHFSFTNIEARRHGLFVSAYLPLNQLWVIMVALVAALLVFILLFVETEITELLLSRKDRCLVKGNGFHWDLLLMGACTLLCSIFGLPWMCAAAVQSLAHCGSLSVPKKTAPGERPGVDYVLEQRVTTIGVSLLMGLFAFGGSYLRLPLASLFGVFLYLGVMNLIGVQFVQRIILFFIPEKYFPDIPYTQSLDGDDESNPENGWLEKDFFEDAPLPV
uniref:Anion exchange protein n=1 Tax=Loa loa TaxID=7209 RepID=A0A1I7VIQ3_LOALO